MVKDRPGNQEEIDGKMVRSKAIRTLTCWCGGKVGPGSRDLVSGFVDTIKLIKDMEDARKTCGLTDAGTQAH